MSLEKAILEGHKLQRTEKPAYSVAPKGISEDLKKVYAFFKMQNNEDNASNFKALFPLIEEILKYIDMSSSIPEYDRAVKECIAQFGKSFSLNESIEDIDEVPRPFDTDFEMEISDLLKKTAVQAGVDDIIDDISDFDAEDEFVTATPIKVVNNPYKGNINKDPSMESSVPPAILKGLASGSIMQDKGQW